MKLDHMIINVGKEYQNDKEVIEKIRIAGLPYEPSWGKGTRGFKASNLWIGNEYFEMIRVLNKNGGGWKKDWVELYNQGHKGMVCIMLDVNDINQVYKNLKDKNIIVTKPQWLEFKWCMKLLTRRMPWKNCYIQFFEGVPFQIGFQQMKDQESRNFMDAYMVPNARDNGIDGIKKVTIRGQFTNKDFELILKVFDTCHCVSNELIEVMLSKNQIISFIKDKEYHVEVYTESTQDFSIIIENITIQ